MGKRQAAHRVSFHLAFGDIPEGLYICHHCDNKLCVRPDHLFLGTQKDNMQDWTVKGKNRLANDRSLWNMGRHWENNDAARLKLSELRKQEFSTGKRIIIRGCDGRIMGTRMVK
ncbi:MAG: HNH endonuclease signature motif containing protein [Candidatus Methylomirabilota bacterium]